MTLNGAVIARSCSATKQSRRAGPGVLRPSRRPLARAPQDEAISLMPSKTYLILRNGPALSRSRLLAAPQDKTGTRLEGRWLPNPLTQLRVGLGCASPTLLNPLPQWGGGEGEGE